jgi:PGF-pre-PGF domain-containing protein
MMRMRSFVLLALVCIGAWVLLATAPSWAAGTTEVQIVKYANDDSTILNETTVDYTWMMNNLVVYGDGVTHYYHQGPIFQDAWEAAHPNETWDPDEDRWNPEEDVNVLEKDLGAVKGTNVKDLCEFVGGMAEGDLVEIKAVDGFSKTFPYETIYEPEPRQGPLVVTWYTKDATESGSESGYVSDGYANGMRLVLFADSSTNPWGKHIFGISDMKACIPQEYWHYYQYPDYPTTTGYTIKYINRIYIHSTLEPPVLASITVSPATVTLAAGEVQQFTATAYDQTGSEMPRVVVTWTISDGTIGTLDENGLFMARSAGSATITASNGTVQGTATVTVQESGGGSGGGSSAKVTPTPTAASTLPLPTSSPSVTRVSRTVPALKANEEVAMIFEEMDITLLALTADSDVHDLTMRVERIEKPANIPTPDSTGAIPYAYYEISAEYEGDASLKGRIEFKVSTSWITNNHIGNVTLTRYEEEGGWAALPTSKVGADNELVYYEAEMPALSLFAIVGVKNLTDTVATAAPAEHPTATPPGTPATAQPPTTTAGSQTPSSSGTMVPGFELGFALVGVLIAVSTSRRRKKIE